jgi:flavin-dependent dehydrogenase
MGKLNTIYDAAIIGGGLGGLTLAIQLAKKGKSVLLFEKESYPFHKVCGEYISNESVDFLESCGIPLKALNLPQINELGISAPNGMYIKHPLGLGGFGISRYTLDALLKEQALLYGVNFYEECKVYTCSFHQNKFALETSKGLFTSYYCFGAYGKKSNMDVHMQRKFVQEKKRGKQNYIAVKYHISIDFAPNLIELHNFKDGYCGISKVDDNRYCLCYLSNEKNLKDHGGNIKTMEQELLYKNPHLKKIFTQANFLYPQPLTISQIRFEPKTQIENHVVMLGDAAGLITPLCGNGMSMAMRASKMLAHLFPSNSEDIQAREDFEKRYQKQWQETFATRLTIGRIFQTLFGSERITYWVLRCIKPFPKLLTQLIRLTHGKPF